MNQRGAVQPIGGAHLKIEGFFKVCADRGLTGKQGVILPASNLRHLALKEEVVQAVKEGRFHVWAIKSAEEFGLEGPVERWRRKSTTRCAGGASIRNLEALCSPTDRSSSTPACCSCPLSDSCRRMNRVCSAR